MSYPAQEQFLQHISSCENMIGKIKDHVDNFLGTHPDDVMWGDVAEADRLSDSLNEIINVLGI